MKQWDNCGAMGWAIALILSIGLSQCAWNPLPLAEETPGTSPVQTYEIVQTYPHDPEAFTQGLVFHQGQLYEGTGLWGRSSVRQVELATGEVQRQQPLERNYFGEGITLWQDQLIQLTWRSQVGFVYDAASLERQAQFPYTTEGWGITHDNERLIMSDGSDRLYFLSPDTFKLLGHVRVQVKGQPLRYLNELEYINGEVYANVWQSDRIARIDPTTGQVTGWIDLTGLNPLVVNNRLRNTDAVLNGIAYDPEGDRLFVTGKLWPQLYEIKLVAPS